MIWYGACCAVHADVTTDVNQGALHTRVVVQPAVFGGIAHLPRRRLRRRYRLQCESPRFRLTFHRCGHTAIIDISTASPAGTHQRHQHRRRGDKQKEPQAAFRATGQRFSRSTAAVALGNGVGTMIGPRHALFTSYRLQVGAHQQPRVCALRNARQRRAGGERAQHQKRKSKKFYFENFRCSPAIRPPPWE